MLPYIYCLGFICHLLLYMLYNGPVEVRVRHHYTIILGADALALGVDIGVGSLLWCLCVCIVMGVVIGGVT